MPCGGARGPVCRAFLSADGPPRECGALEVELFGTLFGDVQYRCAPPQRVGGRVGFGVGEYGQHETLCVPEGVAVIAGAGEALAGNRATLGARACLQHMEEPEPDSLLAVGIAFDLDIGTVPELIEIGALCFQQARPTRVAGPAQCRCGLIVQSGSRAQARPSV